LNRSQRGVNGCGGATLKSRAHTKILTPYEKAEMEKVGEKRKACWARGTRKRARPTQPETIRVTIRGIEKIVWSRNDLRGLEKGRSVTKIASGSGSRG